MSSGGVAMVEEYESLYTGGIHKPEYTSWEKATMSCSGETELVKQMKHRKRRRSWFLYM